MANDLINQFDNTYDSNWGNDAMRQSKWQQPSTKNTNNSNSNNNSLHTFDENTEYDNPYDQKEQQKVPLAIDDIDDDFLKMRNDLRNEISGIINNATSVKKLSGKYLSSTNQDKPQIIKEIDTLIKKNSALTMYIKNAIHDQKLILQKTCKSVESLKVKEFNNLVANFQKSCAIFSQSLTEFDKTVKNEYIRQLDVVDVDKTLTKNDKNKLLNSNDFSVVQKFIQQKYELTDSTNNQLIERLTNLEETNQGLQRIEKSVKELRDLFNELNILVIEQQELIDNIEQNVIETKEKVQSGTKHLEIAEKHQKSTRKIMLIAAICCLIVLLIIIISVVA